MALINCTECKKEISEKALSCPHCGCPVETIIAVQDDSKTLVEAPEPTFIPQAKTDSFKIVRIIIGGICGLILGLAIPIKSGGLLVAIFVAVMGAILASIDLGGFALTILGAIVGVIVIAVCVFLNLAMRM